MNRSSTFVSTVVPVLTLGLGIMIGWRLGPEPAFQSGDDAVGMGHVRLTGSSGGLFDTDPATGDAAVITSLPDATGETTVPGTQAAAAVGDDTLQYFPEAVSGEPATATDVNQNPVLPSASVARRQQPVSPFDEDVWRSELNGLTDEQADELIEIRERLGKVAAQTLGVSSEPFPALPMTKSESAPEVPEPGRLAVPVESEMRPAIELVASGLPEPNSLQLSSRVEARDADLSPVGQGLSSPGSVEKEQTRVVASFAEPAPDLTGFRCDVRSVCRLNLRNQRTPGFQRSEILIVSADPGRLAWHTRIVPVQGELTATGNAFDVAIDGDGWFMVEQRSGKRCVTRGGLLSQRADGRLGLRTSLGCLPLVPEIRLDETVTGRLLIDGRGTVSVEMPSAADSSTSAEAPLKSVKIGRIVVVDFPNSSALRRTAGSLFTQTAESGAAFEATNASLRQGHFELPDIDADSEQSTADELLRFADQLQTDR